MSELITAAIREPFLVGFLSVVVALLIAFAIQVIFFDLPNRVMRHQNIKQWGWPPPHCNADGEFPPQQEVEHEDDDT